MPGPGNKPAEAKLEAKKKMPDFLFEIGLEEIPARMIAPAQAELARRVEDLLTRERLLDVNHEVHSYSTPRRLAVLVKSVHAAQADTEEQLTGPSWNIAFKNGEPTPAALAFAKKAGVEISALNKVTTPKGEYVAATAHRKGRTASEILAEQLPKELAALYWPKNMYWRAGKPERFVRPVKWLVALLDHAIVPVEFAGVRAANITYGHRILHEESVTLEHADDYLGQLEAAHVTADVELRRHRIRKALDAAVRSVPGARWREDHALVDTVTHLTEWPTVILGSFDPEYLTLPEEVLVTVMRDHQKYFAVEDANHKLAPYFLTVLNTQPEEHGDEIIRHGNQRVLRARFNDARFFWDVDQKILLTERVEMLKSVTFQKDLGSYYWKTSMNDGVAFKLSEILKSKNFKEYSYAQLQQAVSFAKTDLTTELVKEFTELQGIVGGLYARTQGLGDGVAQAIYDQYTPAAIEDPIPLTVEGQLLGMADRIQTIIAMLSIGNAPTGSKDPFALRRAGNSIIKILADSELPLTLKDVIEASTSKEEWKAYKVQGAEFLRERLYFFLKDYRDFAYDVVNAVLAAGYDDVRDAIARAEALSAVRGSDDFIAISAAFKRMNNIIRQAYEKKYFRQDFPDKIVTADLLTDPAERTLHDRTGKLAAHVEELRSHRQYRNALEQIATLRPDIDLFFDKVMVMVEDESVRNNRLALITEVKTSFSSIADFSEIVTS
jgi:glycyl-tRNA synthetase beta chain